MCTWVRACEDKARQLRWGVIFQPYIQPASNGIKNEEAEDERLSKPMPVNGVYARSPLLTDGIHKRLTSAFPRKNKQTSLEGAQHKSSASFTG